MYIYTPQQNMKLYFWKIYFVIKYLKKIWLSYQKRFKLCLKRVLIAFIYSPFVCQFSQKLLWFSRTTISLQLQSVFTTLPAYPICIEALYMKLLEPLCTKKYHPITKKTNHCKTNIFLFRVHLDLSKSKN